MIRDFQTSDGGWLSRREFLRIGTASMASMTIGSSLHAEDLSEPRAQIGLITDLHYADKAPAINRHYRESLPKLKEAGECFRAAGTAHVIELGDLIDAADSVAVEQEYLATIHREFAKIPGQKHYVLGNHCVDTLTKEEFLEGVGAVGSYESFDESGFHIVVLDACFRSDGQAYQRRNFDWKDPNIPADELTWLQQDLDRTTLPTLVFVHQRLDVGSPHGVKNAESVRRLLERSQKVVSVFQGHSHKNEHQVLNGIHYVTLKAMVEGSGVENSGYSLLNLHEGGVVSLTGNRKQSSYLW